MNVFQNSLFRFGVAIVSLASAPMLPAQNVSSETLLHPPTDSWPIYHGDYSGKRHSSLTQITPQNVKGLTLSWAFQTNQASQIKSAPILVDGILYFTVPENVWAVDARSGRQIWHYTAPANKAFHIGHRGVAIYKDKLYYLTSDAHLQCLDAKNGKVKWDVQVADSSKGQWATMSPLIVGNHVTQRLMVRRLLQLAGRFVRSGILRRRDDAVAVGCDLSGRNSKEDLGRQCLADRDLRSGTESGVLGDR